jgi:hypothetical protein
MEENTPTTPAAPGNGVKLSLDERVLVFGANRKATKTERAAQRAADQAEAAAQAARAAALRAAAAREAAAQAAAHAADHSERAALAPVLKAKHVEEFGQVAAENNNKIAELEEAADAERLEAERDQTDRRWADNIGQALSDAARAEQELRAQHKTALKDLVKKGVRPEAGLE